MSLACPKIEVPAIMNSHPVRCPTPFPPEAPSHDTPFAPNSPSTPKWLDNGFPTTQKYCIDTTLDKMGYSVLKSLGVSLQGSICKVRCSATGRSSVVKVTRKDLHEKSITMIDGHPLSVEEDVVKEMKLLRYLNSNNPPKSVIRLEAFFQDQINYFLVMQDGGQCLFDFVVKCHKLIGSKQLRIEEWRRFCRILLVQMVDLMVWLHSSMKVCHLDISLENWVIDNVMVTVSQNGELTFNKGIRLKLIDFGLAEKFKDDNFCCAKFVGKTKYKAPEVFSRRAPFDARAADVWSLGVTLFMMAFGAAPYLTPSRDDVSFCHLIDGKMINILLGWDRTEYATHSLLDLLSRMLRPQKQRLTMDEVRKHPWLL